MLREPHPWSLLTGEAIASSDEPLLEIEVEKKLLPKINNFSLSSQIDSIASVFSFDIIQHRESGEYNAFISNALKPLYYREIEFYNVFPGTGPVQKMDVADDRVRRFHFFKGTVVNHKFISSKDAHHVNLSGYSSAGILEDVCMPQKEFTPELHGMSFRDILKKLLKPYNLLVHIESNANRAVDLIFDKVKIEPDETIKDILSKLAIQRNVILTHDIWGRLWILKPEKTKKVYRNYNPENCTTMTLEVNGQNLHSHITVVRQPSKEQEDSEIGACNDTATPLPPTSSGDCAVDDEPMDYRLLSTVTNPMVKKFRPKTIKLSNSKDFDTLKSADSLIGEELKNISITIEIPRWDGMFNADLVRIINPEIGIFKEIVMMVSSTEIKQNSESGRSMSFTCVPVETYTTAPIKNILE